jgi:hypothetical protein
MGQPNEVNPAQKSLIQLKKKKKKKKKKTRSLSRPTQKPNPLKAAHLELKTLGFLWGLELRSSKYKRPKAIY